ncbi:MAG: WD40 repeat domain-containing protein, partial [Myxococcota bacterium]
MVDRWGVAMVRRRLIWVLLALFGFGGCKKQSRSTVQTDTGRTVCRPVRMNPKDVARSRGALYAVSFLTEDALAVAGEKGVVEIWWKIRGVWSIWRSFSVLRDGVTSLAAVGQGRLLVGGRETLILWDIEQKRALRRWKVPGLVNAVRWHARRQRFALALSAHRVAWGSLQRISLNMTSVCDSVRSVAWSDTGTHFASLGDDGRIRIHAVASRVPLQAVQVWDGRAVWGREIRWRGNKLVRVAFDQTVGLGDLLHKRWMSWGVPKTLEGLLLPRVKRCFTKETLLRWRASKRLHRREAKKGTIQPVARKVVMRSDFAL